MLPRLQPRTFYDLVIEVAIVRPGPIQGGTVHPYLRRRQRLEPVTYPSDELETALGRTLGVPIFQEQVMQVAMLAAGFTPGEADQLRRAMAAWKRKGGLQKYYDRIVNGMLERGYEQGLRRSDLRADQGLRRVRLSGEPCGEFRAARLCEQLAQVPRAGGVSGRDAQLPADGLLLALAARAGREAAWRRGAAGRRHDQRLGFGSRTP